MNILGGCFAQNQTAERPINDSNAIQVTGTEHQIRIFCSFQEHRDIIRVMRKITIQFEDAFSVEKGMLSAVKQVEHLLKHGNKEQKKEAAKLLPGLLENLLAVLAEEG